MRLELQQFNPVLLDKPFAVAFTKSDLLGPEPEFSDPLEGMEMPRFLISAVTGRGLPELVAHLGRRVNDERKRSDLSEA